MSAIGKGIKKIGKTVGGAIGGLFGAPKVVVEDNSQQVADAINQQAADEKKAKEDAELKEQQEKEYREKVAKDQEELENLKTTGTSETSESDLSSSGLNEVNTDPVLDEMERMIILRQSPKSQRRYNGKVQRRTELYKCLLYNFRRKKRKY